VVARVLGHDHGAVVEVADGLAGLLAGLWRTRHPALWAILATVLTVTAVNSFFVSEARHNVRMVPLLAAGGAAGAALSSHESEIKVTAAVVLAAIAVHGLVTLRHTPGAAPQVAATGPRGHYAWFLAITMANPLTIASFAAVAAASAPGSVAAAIAFVAGATLFSLVTQACVLGSGAATLARQLDIGQATLMLTLLPHALPELTALFLPLAAWLVASRRRRFDELLAATLATTAIALPVLVIAAGVEIWVWPQLLRAASPLG
jgi:hypothetical protein